jgi:[ribosomal protein S18]-alanine N-acetyltransferase
MIDARGEAGYVFRALTDDDARAISGWRYEGPYAVYDTQPRDAARMLALDSEYHAALTGRGELVGFCCFGAEARVPGLAEEPGTLDVGGGLRPDLTGIGLGADFLRSVCALGGQLHDPLAYRLVVLAFNARAQRVAHALGFERTDLHSTGGREFVVMRRAA